MRTKSVFINAPRLRAEIERAGLTPQSLSIKLGWERTFISHSFERGQMSIKRYNKLVKALDIQEDAYVEEEAISFHKYMLASNQAFNSKKDTESDQSKESAKLAIDPLMISYVKLGSKLRIMKDLMCHAITEAGQIGTVSEYSSLVAAKNKIDKFCSDIERRLYNDFPDLGPDHIFYGSIVNTPSNSLDAEMIKSIKSELNALAERTGGGPQPQEG